jgi:hypothetical protein
VQCKVVEDNLRACRKSSDGGDEPMFGEVVTTEEVVLKLDEIRRPPYGMPKEKPAQTAGLVMKVQRPPEGNSRNGNPIDCYIIWFTATVFQRACCITCLLRSAMTFDWLRDYERAQTG